MSITLDSLTLPEDLHWGDEFDWSPVEQSTEYATDGALLIEEGVKLAGRPLTLIGDESSVWVTRSLIEALHATLADPADKTLTLHDGRALQVRWRHPNPIKAPQLRYLAFRTWIADPDAETLHAIEALQFLIVG